MEYHYDNFSILLPVEHMLPQYQQKHVKYDRFLPHLGSYIEDKATVIDVGANCGDTLAGMVEKNPNATYVCIEPDATFFNYLETNIIRMKQALKNISVHTVKTLVGRSVTNVSLEGTGGTKHAVIGENKGGTPRTHLTKYFQN